MVTETQASLSLAASSMPGFRPLQFWPNLSRHNLSHTHEDTPYIDFTSHP
jgi:hypothetical protein